MLHGHCLFLNFLAVLWRRHLQQDTSDMAPGILTSIFITSVISSPQGTTAPGSLVLTNKHSKNYSMSVRWLAYKNDSKLGLPSKLSLAGASGHAAKSHSHVGKAGSNSPQGPKSSQQKRLSMEAESALVGGIVASDNTLTVACEEPWERRPS